MQRLHIWWLGALLAGAAPLAAQSTMPGFLPAGTDRQRALERALLAGTDTADAVAMRRKLAAEPHVGGTPAQQRTAAYVLETMARYGLDTSRTDFTVYLPFPDSTIVERVTPSRVRLKLEEPPLPSDPTTQGPIWPAMNGHAASGDVTAPLVYVNYGLPDDYALLDSMGVSVKDKVVIARYGRSFRGIKAREAHARGAAALILYSDPQDDGYVRGDVYPDGPMRNPDGVQRGSVLNDEGDPSTPGWPSVAGARRLPVDSMALPRITVVPIGYRNAALLLEPLRGNAVPQPWQGGLPFRYHVGGGEVSVRVGLWHEPDARAFKKITNTFGTIRGKDFPDEIVVVGGHRDAWGPGARDNVGGTAAVLQAARAWGAALKAGLRPRRTLVFATWDAEEWGLIGSAEYVESREDELRRKTVAYLNLDDAADGRHFGADATSSLHEFIRELARAVPQPGESVSVYDAWRRDTRATDSADVTLGDLGGGSDYGSYYNHLGIPSFDLGFGDAAGTYHSAYDTYTFQDRFGDPGGLSIVAAGRLAALSLARLGNADVIPYDYAGFGHYLRQLVREARREIASESAMLPFAPLDSAVAALVQAGEAFTFTRDSALSTGKMSGRAATRANAELRRVEQELTRPEGLVGRPWQRNLVFVADRDNGYSNMALPSLREALLDKDTVRLSREMVDLATRIRAAAGRLDAARGALSRR